MSVARPIGTWTLPSGNSVDVILTDRGLEHWWDEEPSPAWSAEDLAAYRETVRPAIWRAVAEALGVSPDKILGLEV